MRSAYSSIWPKQMIYVQMIYVLDLPRAGKKNGMTMTNVPRYRKYPCTETPYSVHFRYSTGFLFCFLFLGFFRWAGRGLGGLFFCFFKSKEREREERDFQLS